MLEVGTRAPDFKAVQHDGERFSFADWRSDRAAVLYFYVKNFTAGWNRQARGFRDAYEAIRSYGAEVVGVSPDSRESHERFRRHFSIPFTLVSDRDKKIARLYDVARRLGLGVSRVTYLIDGSGVIRGVYHHEVRIGRHVQDVLKGLEALREGCYEESCRIG